jgi:hypothetical protein
LFESPKSSVVTLIEAEGTRGISETVDDELTRFDDTGKADTEVDTGCVIPKLSVGVDVANGTIRFDLIGE